MLILSSNRVSNVTAETRDAGVSPADEVTLSMRQCSELLNEAASNLSVSRELINNIYLENEQRQHQDSYDLHRSVNRVIAGICIFVFRFAARSVFMTLKLVTFLD